jgi:hypothetical protein
MKIPENLYGKYNHYTYGRAAELKDRAPNARHLRPNLTGFVYDAYFKHGTHRSIHTFWFGNSWNRPNKILLVTSDWVRTEKSDNSSVLKVHNVIVPEYTRILPYSTHVSTDKVLDLGIPKSTTVASDVTTEEGLTLFESSLLLCHLIANPMHSELITSVKAALEAAKESVCPSEL